MQSAPTVTSSGFVSSRGDKPRCIASTYMWYEYLRWNATNRIPLGKPEQFYPMCQHTAVLGPDIRDRAMPMCDHQPPSLHLLEGFAACECLRSFGFCRRRRRRRGHQRNAQQPLPFNSQAGGSSSITYPSIILVSGALHSVFYIRDFHNMLCRVQ
ncbi:hypothetical protein K440DRAFT_381159 [Wilcoxina mikolae CBS 423.85]|nr:hypothetical protein K440DRAFT_381159 [Wilcoxina mikolae CBS 423.85]